MEVSGDRVAWVEPAQQPLGSGWEKDTRGIDGSKVGETGMLPSFRLK